MSRLRVLKKQYIELTIISQSLDSTCELASTSCDFVSDPLVSYKTLIKK